MSWVLGVDGGNTKTLGLGDPGAPIALVRQNPINSANPQVDALVGRANGVFGVFTAAGPWSPTFQAL